MDLALAGRPKPYRFIWDKKRKALVKQGLSFFKLIYQIITAIYKV
jgi:hypothetical protein